MCLVLITGYGTETHSLSCMWSQLGESAQYSWPQRMDRHTLLLVSIELHIDGTAPGDMKDMEKLPESMINTWVERKSCMFRPYAIHKLYNSPLNAVLLYVMELAWHPFGLEVILCKSWNDRFSVDEKLGLACFQHCGGRLKHKSF